MTVTDADESQVVRGDSSASVRAHDTIGDAHLEQVDRVHSRLTWPSATSSLALTDYWFFFWLVLYRLAVITLFVMAIASAVDR